MGRDGCNGQKDLVTGLRRPKLADKIPDLTMHHAHLCKWAYIVWGTYPRKADMRLKYANTRMAKCLTLLSNLSRHYLRKKQ